LASHLTFVRTTGHLTQKQGNPIENRKSGHPKLACPYRKICTEILESVNVVCDCYLHLTYTVCPGSVGTLFIKNTRCELFSKCHSFYSKLSPSESIYSWNRLKSFRKQSLYSFCGITFKTVVHSLWMSWMVS
jgi:hypothetical protein